ENFNFDTNTATATSSWCYNDESTNCDTYGKLYTWDAASQLAPEGWKLPTQGDWQVLFNEVGINVAHTELMNGDFQALLAGHRRDDESFGNFGHRGYYWSSTVGNETNEYYLYAIGNSNFSEGTANNNFALSVRLIKILNN
uniref:FISUMP domain-containing protein n=1 Tax=Flavobacterium sp. J27 TaxID=2060419 RepID=UPI00272A3CB4